MSDDKPGKKKKKKEEEEEEIEGQAEFFFQKCNGHFAFFFLLSLLFSQWG